MSCGSANCTSTAISVTVPAIRFVPAEWPTIRWRAFLHAAVDRAALFTERRLQRLALLELVDRLLGDIGVSRADARAEAHKPFWRQLSGGVS